MRRRFQRHQRPLRRPPERLLSVERSQVRISTGAANVRSSSPPPSGRRARGGAEARRAARTGPPSSRRLHQPQHSALRALHRRATRRSSRHNAETVLQEIGIDFRDDPEALAMWKEAGADVKGDRVRFPKGLVRSLLKTAPREFTQHARNPERSVAVGGSNTVFAPVYGPPFIRNLDEGRRYATIEDFRNFVKLAYMSPSLHHSGGTVCEPVDIPVAKRHLDMVYSHIRYSDKPFMGSVTAPERAEDSVSMAKMVFGDEFVDQNCVTDQSHQRQFAAGLRRHDGRRAQGLCPQQPGDRDLALHPVGRHVGGDRRSAR